MSRSAIQKRIIEIINEKIINGRDEMTEAEVNKKLLGSDIDLDPRDLIFLFHEVEKEFNVEFKEDTINRIGFRSVADICKSVEKEQSSNASQSRNNR